MTLIHVHEDCHVKWVENTEISKIIDFLFSLRKCIFCFSVLPFHCPVHVYWKRHMNKKLKGLTLLMYFHFFLKRTPLAFERYHISLEFPFLFSPWQKQKNTWLGFFRLSDNKLTFLVYPCDPSHCPVPVLTPALYYSLLQWPPPITPSFSLPCSYISTSSYTMTFLSNRTPFQVTLPRSHLYFSFLPWAVTFPSLCNTPPSNSICRPLMGRTPASFRIDSPRTWPRLGQVVVDWVMKLVRGEVSPRSHSSSSLSVVPRSYW